MCLGWLRYSSIAMLQWLHDTFAVELQDAHSLGYVGQSWPMRIAACAMEHSGELHVLQWLQATWKLEECLPYLMTQACCHGRMEIGQWVWESTDNKRSIDFVNSALDNLNMPAIVC
jgi:hypothetical protein